jgi:hypothetical protein
MKQLLWIMTVVLAATGGAHAQPADSEVVAKLPLARRLYEEGVDAAGSKRWSIAFDRFKASYELAPRAQTLFNLARAQGETGRLVEATENYRRFLRETTEGRFPELRADAVEQLELLERQIAQVVLDITNLEAGDVIAIDEIEFPRSVVRVPIPMNPGPHIARVRRGAKVMATRTLALDAGATESIRIELPATALDLEIRPPVDPPAMTAVVRPPVHADRPTSNRWLRSPWLWSGVAVVVAGGAAGAYVFTRPDGVVVR